jgi:LacI family transcriptional regulator
VKNRRVTLADIARACDVSRATVSLVLRGSPLTAAATRARVEAELKRQGDV